MRGMMLLAAGLAASCDRSEETKTSSTTETSPPDVQTTPPETEGEGTETTSPTTTFDPSVLALAPPSTVANGRFATSDVCAECHANAPGADAMRDEDDLEIGPYDLWQGSMMANSARDPLWRAVMSAEVAATPAAAAAIEAKCLTCHASMAHTDAALLGDPPLVGTVLTDLTDRSQLALDGVSCTTCHQVEPDGLGTEASLSGGYVIAGQGRIYGPHANPFSMPMLQHTGFEPIAASHVTRSELCATCHVLTTHALDPDGTDNGGQVLEQATWLEWRNSSAESDGLTCQGCHLPTRSAAGAPLSTAIARSPSGSDFPPIGARSPYGRHLLVGGNTLVPQILRDQAALLQPRATAAAFDATIAAAREQLETRTAAVRIEDATFDGERLSFDVRAETTVGHKLPTGIPLRRAWLHVTVTDADGALLFESGGWDSEGRLVDRAGAVLPAEEAGGPVLPHVDQVSSEGDLPIYESVLADREGAPTWRLIRGAGWAKDNRLLPAGWQDAAATADGTAPVGTSGDPDFGAGGDVVHYVLSAAGAAPLTVEAELRYQPLSARAASELFATGTPEALAFRTLWQQADRSPELLGTDEVAVP